MYCSFVIQGEATQIQPQILKRPPEKPMDDQLDAEGFPIDPMGVNIPERYDSVINSRGDQTIIFAGKRQYPGYLITYE